VTVRQVFITGAKAGSQFEAVTRDGAIVLSTALQYGVPLETIKHAVTRDANNGASTLLGAIIERITARSERAN
jgi:hypothetical protein